MEKENLTTLFMIVSLKPPLAYIHALQLRYYQYAMIYHNRDCKEPHYHLIINFQRKFRKQHLQQIFRKFQSNIYIEPIRNLKDSIQYLIHKNDKSKFQYDKSEIIWKNGEKWEQHI